MKTKIVGVYVPQYSEYLRPTSYRPMFWPRGDDAIILRSDGNGGGTSHPYKVISFERMARISNMRIALDQRQARGAA